MPTTTMVAKQKGKVKAGMLIMARCRQRQM